MLDVQDYDSEYGDDEENDQEFFNVLREPRLSLERLVSTLTKAITMKIIASVSRTAIHASWGQDWASFLDQNL